jgi:hypothetical protein
VPRATYMPFPFEIVQTPKTIAIAYEFAHALRTIPMDGSPHPDGLPDTWMGDSRGRWDGDTLVVDVNSFNDQTWFDHAGNFHSDALRVVERYTLANPDHISYVEDEHASVSPNRRECQAAGIRMRLLPAGGEVQECSFQVM